MCVCVCVCVCVFVCVCVVRESVRKKERESVCVCVRERERVRVRETERESERERVCVCVLFVCLPACPSVFLTFTPPHPNNPQISAERQRVTSGNNPPHRTAAAKPNVSTSAVADASKPTQEIHSRRDPTSLTREQLIYPECLQLSGRFHLAFEVVYLSLSRVARPILSPPIKPMRI